MCLISHVSVLSDTCLLPFAQLGKCWRGDMARYFTSTLVIQFLIHAAHGKHYHQKTMHEYLTTMILQNMDTNVDQKHQEILG
jgi:hypothetical protein